MKTTALSQVLSQWFANPVSEHDGKLQMQVALKHTRTDEDSAILARLQEVILAYWTGKNIAADIENIKATYHQSIECALADLVYGQLLMSKKSVGAMDYLNAGFKQAAHFFPAKDYLEVMRRHQRLDYLVLSVEPMAAFSLQELLIEADIVAQLSPDLGNKLKRPHDQDDVIG